MLLTVLLIAVTRSEFTKIDTSDDIPQYAANELRIAAIRLLWKNLLEMWLRGLLFSIKWIFSFNGIYNWTIIAKSKLMV
jgi:hypothetical protein